MKFILLHSANLGLHLEMPVVRMAQTNSLSLNIILGLGHLKP